MALDFASLFTDLYNLFSDPPDNIPDCAEEWASAMANYAKSVTPASVTVVAAANGILKPALVSAFSQGGGISCNTLTIELAFKSWATSVAGGMVGWTAVAPPGFINMCDLDIYETHIEAAIRFTEKIDTWMKTGTATLIAPPYTTTTWL